MGIWDSILNRVRQIGGSPEMPEPNTSLEVVPPPRQRNMSAVMNLVGGAGGDRHDIIRACRAMIAGDGRAEETLDMLSRDATKGGFTVTVENNPAAQEVINRLIIRAGLDVRQAADWLKMAARDGDLFLELGIDKQMEIAQITRKPTLEMVRLSDEFGLFPDPVQAYAWTDQESARRGKVGQKPVYFPQFIVVHGRWNHDSDSRYGRPEYASSLSAYNRVVEGERDMAVRRRTNAGIRFVHKIEEWGDEYIEAYQAVNEKALKDPFGIVSDYYISAGSSIETLGGDPNLGDIADVEHHIQTWSAGSPVPLELLAYGENLNRDVLREKKAQYDETILDTQNWITDQVLRPIIERQLLLFGILPETLEYKIVWAGKQQTTAAQLAQVAMTMEKLLAIGLSPDAVWAVVGSQLPHVTMEQLFGDWVAPTAAAVAGEEPAGQQETITAMHAANRLIARMEQALAPGGAHV